MYEQTTRSGAGAMARPPACLFAALLIWVGFAAGCAAATVRSRPALVVDPQRARMPLDRIEPAVSLSTASAPAASQPSIPAGARRYFEAGRDRFEERLWGEAINELARAVQVAPSFHDARVLLGRAALLQGNTALARTHLQEAARQRGDDVDVHQLLGDLSFQAHDYAAAIGHFRRALLCPNAKPGRPATILSHLFLGLSLREEGYLTAAANQLEQFVSAVEGDSAVDGTHPELTQVVGLYRDKAALGIGEIYDVLDLPQEAIAAYRRALALRPGEREVETRLARALARGGQSAEALALARKVCEADEASPASIEMLLEVCDSGNPRLDAEAELIRLGESSRNPAVLQRLASRLLDRGRAKEASALLERSVTLQPERFEGRLELALVRLRLDDVSGYLDVLADAVRQAKDSFERVDSALRTAADNEGLRRRLIDAARQRAEARKDAVYLVLLGRLLWLDNRVDEASRVLSDATAADSKLGLAYATLAELRIARGRWSDALAACDAAEQAGVRDGTLYRLRGQALEGMDDGEGAMAAYEEALRLNGRDADALMAQARLLDQAGRPDEAIKALRKVVTSVDPARFDAREALIRALLPRREFRAAKEQFSAMQRRGAPTNVLGRTEALIVLAMDTTTDGNTRLGTYRSTLSDLMVRFPDDGDTALDLSLSYVATREYAEALRVIDRMLAVKPQFVRGRELKVTLLARLLRFAEAIELQRSLLAERPNNAAWRARLGDLALDAGEYAIAEDAFRTLAKREDLAGRRGVYLRGLLLALQAQKRHDESVEVTKSWLDLDPESDQLRSIYMAVLNEADRAEEALAAADRWLAESPESSAAREMMVWQLIRMKRYDEAQARALAWHRAEPTDAESIQRLISVLLGSRRMDEAVELARTAAEDPALRDSFETRLVYVLERAGRYEEAIQVVQGWIRTTQNAGLLLELSRLYSHMRRWQEAEKAIERLVNPEVARMAAGRMFDPETVRSGYRQLAVIFQYSGRMPACHSALEKAHELTPIESPEYPGSCNDLGYLWADSGVNLDQAEALTRIAVGEAPRRAAYLDSLGWVLYKKGDVAGSLRWLKQAVDRSDVPDPVVLDHYGDALYRSGRRDEALTYWREAAKLVREAEGPVTPEHEAVGERCGEKIAAAEAGRPVETASTATDPAGK